MLLMPDGQLTDHRPQDQRLRQQVGRSSAEKLVAAKADRFGAWDVAPAFGLR
jgi:hypothetical protein